MKAAKRSTTVPSAVTVATIAAVARAAAQGAPAAMCTVSQAASVTGRNHTDHIGSIPIATKWCALIQRVYLVFFTYFLHSDRLKARNRFSATELEACL